MSGMPSARHVALAVAFAALVTLPFWMPGIYYINVSSQFLFYAIFALGLNILVGYGGLVSLGHAGLFGITAYATAYLLSMGLGHTTAILGALVMQSLQYGLSFLQFNSPQINMVLAIVLVAVVAIDQWARRRAR